MLPRFGDKTLYVGRRARVIMGNSKTHLVRNVFPIADERRVMVHLASFCNLEPGEVVLRRGAVRVAARAIGAANIKGMPVLILRPHQS